MTIAESGTPATPARSGASLQQQLCAARLLRALGAFTATVRHALESGAAAPEQAGRWQGALGFLENDLRRATDADAQCRAGDPGPAAELAGRLCFLARDMDSYPLDFAGEDLTERLAAERRLVVLAAWQMKEAAQ